MEEMFAKAHDYERQGGRLSRYSPDGLGPWVRKQQNAWTKLTLPQKEKLRQLKAFADFNPATFHDTEWAVMMGLCEQFEQKTGELISPKEVFGGFHIGQWLTEQKKFMRVCEEKRQRGHKRYIRLAKLRTLQHWEKNRPKTVTDRFNQSMDDLFSRGFSGAFIHKGDALPKKTSSGEASGSSSHYDVLQVHPAASNDVVKAAFRALALTKHPDKQPRAAECASHKGGNHSEWVRIQAAYDVLSDPEKRRKYDMQLRNIQNKL